MRNWRYAAVVFFAAFILSVACHAAEDTQERITIPVEPQGLVYMSMDEQHFCSGFIIKPGFVITAGHCVHPAPKKIEVKLFDGSIEIFTVYKTSYEEGNFQHEDWAILQGDTRGFEPLVPGEPEEFTPVVNLSGRNLHRLASPGALVKVINLQDGSEEFLLIIDVKHGDSGGPLIGHDNKVIGIITDMGGAHEGRAGSIKNVLKFLP